MEDFVYYFENGNEVRVYEGEDGYTVSFKDENLMGTFTDIENLLKGISDVCRDNFKDMSEGAGFAMRLSDLMGIDYDTCFELLMK